MIDFNDKHLMQIESLIEKAAEQSGTLGAKDIDPREIVYQIIEQVKQNLYKYGEVQCAPNIITISIPETKGDRVEDLETIFNTREFFALFEKILAGQQIRLFNPLRVEVQTVSKGNSRVMYGRAALALDWPGPEMAAEDVRVSLDLAKKQVLSLQPPRPQIPQLARLTSLNAEVYKNQYLITKPTIHVGRLRSVVNEQTGKLIRRNDFVFAHQDNAEATSNSVSRQHATIYYRANIFCLIDHGSANGTAIRRGNAAEFIVKPEHAQGVQLEHEDVLRFGSAWVKFEIVPLEEADFNPYSSISADVSQTAPKPPLR
jgi:hypothetical protein